MKRFIHLFVLLNCIFPTIQAQNFHKEHIISFYDIKNLSGLTVADFDNDGDEDILMFEQGNESCIAWVENFGSMVFSYQQDIETNISGIIDVFTSDIDNDGNSDILSASQIENSVFWYKNDGNGNFSQAKIISDTIYSVQTVFAIDIDGDGDNDIISGSLSGNLAWYKNDGEGNFGVSISIDDELSKLNSIISNDLDNDGDNDIIVITSDESLIAWYENKNVGDVFEKHIVTTQIDGGESVFSADIDSDGYFDILSASYWDGKIAWYKNDGNGTFGEQIIISENTGYATSVFASDIDNDGDLDVISAFWNTKKIILNENLGNGVFGEQIIVSEVVGGNSIITVDIDNDGDEDVLSNGYLYENDGNGNFGDNMFVVNVVMLPNFVEAIDANNDGDIDILYSSAYFSGWFENKSNSYYQNHYLNNEDSLMQCNKISLTDIDNDGIIDIFYGYNGAVVRYNISSNGEIVYDGIVDSIGYQIETLDFADFDNDGDDDILVSTSYWDYIWTNASETQIAWLENLNNGNDWLKHKLFSYYSLGCFYRSASADIDNDGDIDILSTNCIGDSVYLFKNAGNGTFSLKSIDVPEDIYLTNFYLQDIDCDDDIDIVSSVVYGYFLYSIVWFENVNGDLFYESHFIDNTDFSYSFLLEDINNDGFTDIVTNNSSESIGFLYGKGDGSFELTDVFENNKCFIRDISSNDMDNDGDLDILYCDEYSDKIAWIENEQNSTVNESYIDKVNIYPNPFYDEIRINLSCEFIADLYNSEGSKLLSFNKNSVNLSFLPEGIYMIIFRNTNGKIQSSSKLIKM